jgi:quercetin dioxygenase-like cupin family protein
VKLIVFKLAAGEALAQGKTPLPATLTFLKGEATLMLGADEQDAAEGSFVYMTPHLQHSVKAKTDVIMLLTVIKDQAIEREGVFQ